ncbi:kinase A anchor protein [Stachybotrys elegans]|uniref:Kinase A anchor protein n=1 Tax=Stachybotrys elegans TaxID=80388 RepID=A0A8K0SLI2_9HYPO|nr:kinase A anchor protein [Stachybotrys elegans]
MPPKPMPTHFLCIPLAGPQLARSLADFRADVTSATGFGIPVEAVRPLGTLHLTLGVMVLRDDALARAIDTVRGLRLADALAAANPAGGAERRPSVTLRGLHPMQAASRTSVLYAPPVDADGVLFRFCQQLRKPFLDGGLMADEGRPLLLHATIVNTIYVKGRGGGGGGRGGKRERLTLDARDMLSRYDDYVWMEDMPLDKVTLCRMGAKKVEGDKEGDEAYEVVAEVGF